LNAGRNGGSVCSRYDSPHARLVWTSFRQVSYDRAAERALSRAQLIASTWLRAAMPLSIVSAESATKVTCPSFRRWVGAFP
jgi:hypothetical protein